MIIYDGVPYALKLNALYWLTKSETEAGLSFNDLLYKIIEYSLKPSSRQ